MRIDWYAKLKEERRCVSCREPLEPGNTRVLCDVCRDLRNKKRQERYWTRRAEERCVSCGEPAMPGKCKCFQCARIESFGLSERRKARRKK